MAHPRTLPGLLRELGLSLNTVLLSCAFCNDVLSVRELCKFNRKNLCLVWKKGFPFGVCSPCLLLEAQIFFWRHFEYSVCAQTLEKELQGALGELQLRCYSCYTFLDIEDKRRMVAQGRRFHRIQGLWRGICVLCSSGFRR
nr:MAG: E6 protein [Arctocephalus gazella papillomavirus 2]